MVHPNRLNLKYIRFKLIGLYSFTVHYRTFFQIYFHIWDVWVVFSILFFVVRMIRITNHWSWTLISHLLFSKHTETHAVLFLFFVLVVCLFSCLFVCLFVLLLFSKHTETPLLCCFFYFIFFIFLFFYCFIYLFIFCFVLFGLFA